jgi:hypothetical protein
MQYLVEQANFDVTYTRHSKLRPFQSFLLSSEILHTISAVFYAFEEKIGHVFEPFDGDKLFLIE